MLPELQTIDTIINSLMKEWNVSGFAISIVKSNQVIYSKGFGLRDVENELPITPNTIFPIASLTKAFVSTSIAILVDEGKIHWDTPLRQYIPKFHMKDEFISEHITIRDVLSHRTGLPRHDFVTQGLKELDELFNRLPHLDSNGDFRTKYQYNNLMYILASLVIKELTGKRFHEFLSERILQSLNMTRTNFSVVDTQKDSNFAKPYVFTDSVLKAIDFLSSDPDDGSGSINSSIVDMSKWLLFHLNNGKYNDIQLVSMNNHHETHIPTTIIPDGSILNIIPDQRWSLFAAY